MSDRTKERLGGLFLIAIGAFLVWMTWRGIRNNGSYMVMGAWLGPVALVLGVTLQFLKSPRKPGWHNLTEPQEPLGDRIQAMPVAWKIAGALSILAGAAHWAFIEFGG